MPVNSCQKGKKGEREAVTLLKSIGFSDAQRTRQYNGLGLSDVICPSSLPELHIEVKYGNSNEGCAMELACDGLERACHQADRDAAGSPWCVLWRPNRKQWRLSYRPKNGVVVTVAGAVDIAVTLRELNGGAE